MKTIFEYLSTKIIKPSIIKATDETIYQIVKDELDRLGHDADLNHIDVSEVGGMPNLFNCDNWNLGPKYKDLNPDISKWNVSNVSNMKCMFNKCKNFNQDISKWDVSNVLNMQFMFYECENFNQDLSRWEVSSVENMEYMFNGCKKFNCNIGGWDVSSVKNMQGMFDGCSKFNQDLSQWKVGNVEDKTFIFFECPIKEEYKPTFK